MTRQISRTLLALSIATALGGCGAIKNNPIYGDNGLIRDRAQDYEAARPAERLILPPEMKTRKMEDQLEVPDVGTTASVQQGGFEVPRPEFFYADAGSESVNLKREDGERIIIVDEPIADVWVKLQEFWAFNDIKLTRVDPRAGIMETDWILLDGDEYSFIDGWIKRLTFQEIDGGSRNKLRISLRPDAEDYQRTSIRMQHVEFPLEEEVSSIDWESAQARDVEYKADMMFEMLRYLSKASEPDAQSLVSLQEETRENPQLGRDSRGNPVLKLPAPIDQSWAQLNSALDEAEIDVGTRDQQTGMIYLTYTTSTPVEDTERMGFFEWLHSDREDIKFDTSFLSSAMGVEADEDDPNAIRYSSGQSEEQETASEVASDLADPNNPANQDGYKIWFGGKVLYVFGSGESGVFNSETNAYEHTGRYQLKLNRTRSGVYLSVLSDQGLAAPDVVAEEILWDIKEHLPQGRD